MDPAAEAELQRQLQALFREELQDNLGILGQGLAALEDEGADLKLLTDLFRAAHSLKGAAHSAGVAAAVQPCHRMEDAFAALRSGQRHLDTSMLGSLTDDLAALVRLEAELQPGARTAPVPGPAEPSRRGVTTTPTAPAGVARARVAVGRLDRLVDRSGALVATTHRLRALTDDLAAVADGTSRPHRAKTRGDPADAGIDELGPLLARARALDRQLRSIADQVSDTAQELRLQPFHEVAAGLDRAVRELARATRTEARLELHGGDVEVDRDVGDALREPLLHLVRNAVDHGIEEGHRRVVAGKTRVGTVRVAAEAQGGHVRIVVSDDGAGVDLDRLRALAGRTGDTDTDDDAVELAFRPGLSTAPSVTDVSGRGVGLDAARAKIEALGGTFHLSTVRASGTEITIHVPRTLAVVRAIVVDVGDDDLVALPIAGVARLHRVAEGAIDHLEGRSSVVIDQRRRPAVHLGGALSLPRGVTGPGAAVAVAVPDEEPVLLVGRALDEVELVLRPLPRRVTSTAGLLGTAVLPDGRPALVANPSAALRLGSAMAAPSPTPASPRRRPRVLLAEDTPTTRALERSILERGGYDVIVAADGFEAFEALRTETIDVVVTDVDMPRMDGIELCRSIRGSVRLRETPVILVTSLASDADRQRGLEAGASAYLVKSAFDQAALLDAVGRFA